MTNEEIVEEILYSAYQEGISQEVRVLAEQIREAGERCTACAYQKAFDKLTK